MKLTNLTTEKVSRGTKLGPYRTLDAWRGFASFMVMMYHTEQVLALQYHCKSWLLILFRNGNLGVNVFFVISGYCIAAAAGAALRRDHGALAFAKARLRRIFPTYWAALTLTSMLAIALEIYSESGHLLHSDLANLRILDQSGLWYFANLTLTNDLTRSNFVVPQAWTLCYEAAFYLVMAVLLWLVGQRFGERVMLWAAHAVTFAAIFTLFLHQTIYPLNLWPEFGCGIVVYHWVRFRETRLLSLLAIGFFACFLVLARLDHSISAASGYIFCWVMMLLLISLHPADTGISTSKMGKPFMTVGIMSYSLYLTHTFSIGFVNQVLKRVIPPGHDSMGTPAAFLIFAVTAVPALLFAWFFFKFCEKPFLSASGRARIDSEIRSAAEPAASPG